ncbi:DUF551 domain-containing protein [[Ruminococcus] gnavus]|uniref:DUF551 domain-containing protein n=1 Tax=Mediterraneibacter gnavus TaxID=33038 RepID=UPI001D041DD3|nr:DUF551 domain-containing protein [Mediterraneibacter gnavus]MCB5652881.1 DUF551 domain-containing protein [Mediterraneibacter gnavus]
MNVLEKILEEIVNLNYHPEGMGCGIEDCGITDRYEACEYGWNEAIETVVEAINNIEEAESSCGNDGWIPVSEKLPEESDYYMACICNDEVCDYDFRKTWFAHADDYDMDKSEWRELYDFERVTAWQPLPEPYKEE